MNKQEVIEKIKNISARETFMSETIWVKRDEVLDIVSQLDEPQKAVLNEEEAEWLEHLKLIGSFTHCLYVITRQGWGYDFEFRSHGKKYKLSCANKNDGDENELTKNRLVNALIYGYGIEKEKLYTARLIFVAEEFNFVNKERSNGNIFISTSETLGDSFQVYFTQAELEEMEIWDNPAFEIEEVKDNDNAKI